MAYLCPHAKARVSFRTRAFACRFRSTPPSQAGAPVHDAMHEPTAFACGAQVRLHAVGSCTSALTGVRDVVYQAEIRGGAAENDLNESPPPSPAFCSRFWRSGRDVRWPCGSIP